MIHIHFSLSLPLPPFFFLFFFFPLVASVKRTADGDDVSVLQLVAVDVGVNLVRLQLHHLHHAVSRLALLGRRVHIHAGAQHLVPLAVRHRALHILQQRLELLRLRTKKKKKTIKKGTRN